jgi:hypothetical protein
MFTIIELIARIDELDSEDVIFAKPEWHRNSEAAIFRLLEDGRAPTEAVKQGFKYLLEVDVARQVLEEFQRRPEATVEEKCDRVIHYAIYDA